MLSLVDVVICEKLTETCDQHNGDDGVRCKGKICKQLGFTNLYNDAACLTKKP